MLKTFQARLLQHVNCELPDVQAGFRKGRGTRHQFVNICWIIKKAREFQKNIYFCFIDHAKAFDCVDHNKLWKILKGMEYQITWPASWETCMQVRKQQLELNMEQQNWFQIGKWVFQDCILSPCLFNYICRVHHEKWWAGGSTAGIKIAGRITSDMQMTPPLWHKVKRN